MEKWQTVYKDKREHRATIVRDVLVDKDIEAVLLNNRDSSYHFGFFEVRVNQTKVLEAIRIINEDIKFE